MRLFSLHFHHFVVSSHIFMFANSILVQIHQVHLLVHIL